MSDALKLTAFFGERDRLDGRFLADALIDRCAQRRVAASILLRGAEGFGIKHQLRSDQLLTLSEDLPLIAIAIDAPDRITALAQEIAELPWDGLLTLERARLLDGLPRRRLAAASSARPTSPGAARPADAPSGAASEARLTIFLGRSRRAADGRPAPRSAVRILHEHGVAGATVLVGVDGTSRGERRRASFFGANADVPAIVLSVGDGDRIEAALPELADALADPVVCLERVRVCKRDGRTLAPPQEPPAADPDGRRTWHKLSVFAGEQSQHAGRALAPTLLRELRRAGLAGATLTRGAWGYHGDHAPHGDSPWRLRRRVPVVLTTLDAPDRARRAYALIDRLTDETGLVISELVPAFRAVGGGIALGELGGAPLDR